MLMAVETFGESLQRIRKSRGLSQAGLARRAALSPSYVNRLEFGERAATLETVLVLAGALDCTDAERDTLLMAAGYLPRGVGMDAELVRLNEWLADDGLPEAYRASVRATVAALVQGCAAVRGERAMEVAA